MDSSSSPHQSWLGFSLSNNYNHHMPSSSSHNSHLDLFQAFDSNNGIIDGHDNDANDPKLEDFLSGSGGGNNSFIGGTSAVVSFSGKAPATNTSTDVYDSQLKSIAASFLCGYSGDQSNVDKQLVVVPPEPVAKKAVDNFGQRTSIYRGVTRHRWTGRYEAHLWDNSCRREGQSRKGRQVYLGGYDKEDKAARAYDLAALKYWGPTTTTNFPISNYENELGEMKNMTRQEFVASLRRKSSGFSRGASIYRGVTRHHQHGRWQARIGRVAGNKDLYLGTFTTQEEAAEAYDIAAIKFRGLNAVTNFDMCRYDVKSIISSNLPIGGTNNNNNKSKTVSSDSENKSADVARSDGQDLSSATSLPFSSSNNAGLSFSLPLKQDANDYWSAFGYNNNHQITNATPFGVEYVNAENGGYYHPQITESGNNRITPYVTPVALNGNNNNYEEASFGNSLVAPSIYSFQSAKPNLSYFQTPIFGME